MKEGPSSFPGGPSDSLCLGVCASLAHRRRSRRWEARGVVPGGDGCWALSGAGQTPNRTSLATGSGTRGELRWRAGNMCVNRYASWSSAKTVGKTARNGSRRGARGEHRLGAGNARSRRELRRARPREPRPDRVGAVRRRARHSDRLELALAEGWLTPAGRDLAYDEQLYRLTLPGWVAARAPRTRVRTRSRRRVRRGLPGRVPVAAYEHNRRTPHRRADSTWAGRLPRRPAPGLGAGATGLTSWFARRRQRPLAVGFEFHDAPQLPQPREVLVSVNRGGHSREIAD